MASYFNRTGTAINVPNRHVKGIVNSAEVSRGVLYFIFRLYSRPYEYVCVIGLRLFAVGSKIELHEAGPIRGSLSLSPSLFEERKMRRRELGAL